MTNFLKEMGGRIKCVNDSEMDYHEACYRLPPRAKALAQGGTLVFFLSCLLLVDSFFPGYNYLQGITFPIKSSLKNRTFEGAYGSTILAAVTSSSFDGNHLKYLDIILSNLAEVCELGFGVRVVLVSYEELKPASIKPVSSRFRTCKRDRKALSHEVQFFPKRNLSKAAFGTSGDLAIRHREIFLKERGNFDYFLVQEDDVSYTSKNIQYFIDSLNFTETLSPSLYPTYFDYEIFGGEKFAGYRMRAGYIFTVKKRLFFASAHDAAGRGYMLSSSDVFSFENDTAWLDSSNVVGEFNPKVASGMALQNFKRLVIPLDTWQHGGVHHLPNKYINIERDSEEIQLASIRFDHLEYIFSSCLQQGYSLPLSSIAQILFEGNCLLCLDRTGATFMDLRFDGDMQLAESKLIVSFRCSDLKEITFPGGMKLSS